MQPNRRNYSNNSDKRQKRNKESFMGISSKWLKLINKRII